nr:reverse transcriptase domain-containing protein [Tanacetum cinerariifolium]
MVPTTTSLTGFSGETTWPLGQLRLLVTIGDITHYTKAWMNLMVVKSLSPYDGIIGRPGLKAIQAVPSTVHGMLKFPPKEGIVTLRSSLMIPAECTGQAPERTKAIQAEVQKLVEARIMREVYYHDWLSNPVKVKKHDGSWRMCVDFTNLNKACPQDCYPLPETDWKPSDMTGVPRSIAEHRLNIREGCPPVRQKKRGQALERTKAIQAEVQKLVEAMIMREVYYHNWLSNPVMVKKHDGSWRMCVDFTDLNKACPQDCYPLPEIDWKVESLCGYPFKCFLDAYKGYHQIQLTAADEEKTAFHTGQGCTAILRCLLASKMLVPHGSSCVDGSGAGLILTNPDGVEFTYALRFQFTASNNEAEYEALIAVIPAEIGMPTYRTTAVDVVNNDEELRLNLDLLEERRELAVMSEAMSKSKMMKYYNFRVRGVAFKPGDFVYRSNDASHAVAGGKLGPKWEGPYEVTDALENGAYKLRSTDGTMLPRT